VVDYACWLVIIILWFLDGGPEQRSAPRAQAYNPDESVNTPMHPVGWTRMRCRPVDHEQRRRRRYGYLYSLP